MNKTDFDVIVIGGGASGMMAAAVAAQKGASVLLLEKNRRVGKKLAITGGGRCNILNAEEDERVLLGHYARNAKFLFSAYHRFGMQQTREYFLERGMDVIVEDRKRAFPSSQKASDVVDLLKKDMDEQGVQIETESEVKKIVAEDGKIVAIITKKAAYTARSVILATGGISKPETGSTGDGFGWLTKLGHTVREPSPNVTPLATKEKWVEKVSGSKLQDVNVLFYAGKKQAFKAHGAVLFTHFGISGPTILNSAHKVAELLEQGEVRVEIDCYPSKDHKELDFETIMILQEHASKQLKNALKHIVPDGTLKLFVELLDGVVDLETNTSKLSKEDRLKIIKLLKGIPLNISHLMGFEKAVVADGGVALSEIDTKTMQSTVIDNLYITGDLLDINRPTGGYSLQLCWTSGYLAGESASKKV